MAPLYLFERSNRFFKTHFCLFQSNLIFTKFLLYLRNLQAFCSIMTSPIVLETLKYVAELWSLQLFLQKTKKENYVNKKNITKIRVYCYTAFIRGHSSSLLHFEHEQKLFFARATSSRRKEANHEWHCKTIKGVHFFLFINLSINVKTVLKIIEQMRSQKKVFFTCQILLAFYFANILVFLLFLMVLDFTIQNVPKMHLMLLDFAMQNVKAMPKCLLGIFY